MFDFLKDGNHTTNKYKSTSQIPYFTGEDLFGNNKADFDTTVETKVENAKEETFTPFFAIEEDLEMEDQVSNSDFASDAAVESVDSDNY